MAEAARRAAGRAGGRDRRARGRGGVPVVELHGPRRLPTRRTDRPRRSSAVRRRRAGLGAAVHLPAVRRDGDDRAGGAAGHGGHRSVDGSGRRRRGRHPCGVRSRAGTRSHAAPARGGDPPPAPRHARPGDALVRPGQPRRHGPGQLRPPSAPRPLVRRAGRDRRRAEADAPRLRRPPGPDRPPRRRTAGHEHLLRDGARRRHPAAARHGGLLDPRHLARRAGRRAWSTSATSRCSGR